MSNADKESEAMNGPDDALSATGMFRGTFRTEPDAFAKPSADEAPLPVRQAPSRQAAAVSGGEFTQLFGSRPAPTKPHVPPVAPFEPASDATQILSAPAAVPKVKGYSSPGGSDSASGEGSFTQLFRSPTAEVSPPRVAPPLPQASKPAPVVDRRDWGVNFETETNRKPVSEAPGVTELFRALSTNNQDRAEPLAEGPISFSPVRPVAAPPTPTTHPAESFTAILQKLTEATPVGHSYSTLQPVAPVVAAPPGQGEFTRIIAADESKALGSAPAPQEAAETRVFPVKLDVPKVAAPTLSAPTLAPPKTKLQEMVPILLVLNAFLMFVLIVLAIFMLLRR